METNKVDLIRWQAPMTKVTYALLPIIVASYYFFGLRALLVLLVSVATAFLTEYVFARVYKEPVTSSIFVTGLLFGLSLPPGLPYWMVALGAIFGVVFGKMVFGGFGRNIFNPALVGRAFLYVSFGNHMTGQWTVPQPGAMGSLLSYLPNGVDTVTRATPGMSMQAGEAVGFLPLFLGNTAGVIGGTSVILVVGAGIYLLKKKLANHRIVVGALGAYFIVQTILWLSGSEGAVNPLYAVCAGSVLFGIVFYATEPVTACKTNEGRWLYGIFIGAMSALITVLSPWPEGTMFAILLANTFAPITDYAVAEWKKAQKAKVAA